MTTAYLYPGQGAQAVGMGRDIHEALAAGIEIFDRAEAATGMPLKKLCFEGPEEELSRTDVAQPAIFTVSAACQKAIENHLSPEQLEKIKPSVAAGLSLGEYTALYAAGCFDFETGVKLVTERGRLMQEAATAVPSGMVSVIGLEDEQKAAELCKAVADGQTLTCANFNCPGQIVLSGEKAACERAAEKAKDFGAKLAVPLKVAGAFHSDIMRPAADAFAGVLESVKFAPPAFPVLSNVDAEPHGEPAEIRSQLLQQLVSPVRWYQCMERLLADGVDTFYEIGPGKVLLGLMKRIDRKRAVTCIGGVEAVEQLAHNA